MEEYSSYIKTKLPKTLGKDIDRMTKEAIGKLFDVKYCFFFYIIIIYIYFFRINDFWEEMNNQK